MPIHFSMSLFQSYIRWLNVKRRTPYRNTPLLGNPNEVVGHAPSERRQAPAFSRARFGKYEKRKRNARIVFTLVALGVLGLVGWLVYESIYAMGLFN